MLNLLFDKFGHITTIFDKMIMLSSLNICKHILQFFFLIFLTVPGNSVGHLPYYPSCNCAKDSSGFVCSSEDSYIRPPEFQVVEVRLHIKEFIFNKRVPFSLLHLIKIIE
jgi:hypothetical protein